MLLDSNNDVFIAVVRAVFLVTGSAILVDVVPVLRRTLHLLCDPPIIAARFHMFSGSRDTEQSADVANQGAATAAWLRVVVAQHTTTTTTTTTKTSTSTTMSWAQCIQRMRRDLELRGHHRQRPELTSSYPMDVHATMHLVPPAALTTTTTRRALLMGIQYTGQGDKELVRCVRSTTWPSLLTLCSLIIICDCCVLDGMPQRRAQCSRLLDP